MIKMCKWLKSQVFCSYFDAIHTMLPAGLNYRLTDYYSVNQEFCSTKLLSDNEAEIFDFLITNGEQPLKKIEQLFTDASVILQFFTYFM